MIKALALRVQFTVYDVNDRNAMGRTNPATSQIMRAQKSAPKKRRRARPSAIWRWGTTTTTPADCAPRRGARTSRRRGPVWYWYDRCCCWEPEPDPPAVSAISSSLHVYDDARRVSEPDRRLHLHGGGGFSAGVPSLAACAYDFGDWGPLWSLFGADMVDGVRECCGDGEG